MSQNINTITSYSTLPKQWAGDSVQSMARQEINMENTYNYNNNKQYKNYTQPLQVNVGGSYTQSGMIDWQYVQLYKKSTNQAMLLNSLNDPTPRKINVLAQANFQPL